MAAADEAELARMVATAANYNDGPIAFRYPRGEGTGAEIPANPEQLEIGKGRIVYSSRHPDQATLSRHPDRAQRAEGSLDFARDDNAVALLSYGTRLAECLKAAEILESQGKTVTVADARFAKPLDEELITRLAQNHGTLITIEEGSRGGFGAFVLDFLNGKDLLQTCRVKTMTLPDIFQDHDDPAKQYETAELTARDILKIENGK
jgi:1-deoxy-D-xylulose-5-phosphate synthase